MHIPCDDAKFQLQSPTGFHRSLGARLHGGYIASPALVCRSSSQRNSPVPHAGQTSAQRTHTAPPDHLPAYPGVVPRVNRSLKYTAPIDTHGGPQRSNRAATAPLPFHRDPRKSTGAMVKTVIKGTVTTQSSTAARTPQCCCQVSPNAHLAPSLAALLPQAPATSRQPRHDGLFLLPTSPLLPTHTAPYRRNGRQNGRQRSAKRHGGAARASLLLGGSRSCRRLRAPASAL